MATLHAPQRPVDTIEGLSNAEQALAGAIIAHADTSDADVFYREIEPELRGYCEAIAHRVGCDSVALFVAEEAGETYLRMRAAYGNLAWAMDSGSEAGVVYPRPDNLPDSISEEDLRTLVKGGGKKSERWGLTLRSWLLGRAFVANTRQDLDYLASRRPDERGPTDHEAYPVHDETKGWAMRTVFRSLLCIPIFARGRTRPPLFLPDDEPDHREFLSAYRVVGLIKLEGKHAKPAARLDWQSFAPQSVTSEVLRETQKRVEAWRRATNLSLRELIGGKADLRLGEQGELVRPRPPIQAANRDLLSRAGSDPDRPPYGKIIDALSEFLGARFTWHDARAVVAMAMQFGRLLALRVSQHADSRELLLDENIVGALDIRHDDVEPLASLMRAANRACHKLRHEMEALEHRIEDAERSEWEQLRPDEPFERRRPIREKRGRVKELGELLAKVARKTAETEERPPEQRVEVADGVQVCLTGVQPLSDGRLELNGPVDLRVELARAPLSTTPPKDEPPVPRAQISGKLTTGPVTCDLSQLGRGASAGSPGADVRRSGDLIHRIVNVHRIDDIAGVRVVCAYLSDINRVLNAMQAQFPERGIVFERSKVDWFLDRPRKGGYRAVHLTVSVNCAKLLVEEDARILRGALRLGDDEDIWLPCEIQLMTAYQHSWSLASHEQVYKVEADIPEDLRDHLRILSDLLYQTDQIADLVRAGIARALEGDDCGCVRLLENVGRSLSLPGLTLVQFAVRCAQLLYRGHFRLGGRPHLAHAVAVARTLVEEFGVNQPELLMAALLHDMWMPAKYRGRQRPATDWRGIVRRECASVLAEMGDRLDFAGPSRTPGARSPGPAEAAAPAEWLDELMAFLARAWTRTGREDRFYRAKAVRGNGQGRGLDPALRVPALVLECAIVASRFRELAFEPNAEAAQTQFEENYAALEELLPLLADSPDLRRRVSRACEKAVREAARQLAITMPVEWAH